VLKSIHGSTSVGRFLLECHRPELAQVCVASERGYATDQGHPRPSFDVCYLAPQNTKTFKNRYSVPSSPDPGALECIFRLPPVFCGVSA
jgi:hypothetical protein